MSGPLGGNGKWGCPKHRGEKLVVTARNCNHSAFNGYRWTPSDYSQVRCIAPVDKHHSSDGVCGHTWRTKAAYVDDLPNA